MKIHLFIYRCLLIVGFLIGTLVPLQAQRYSQQLPEKTRLLFLLDASGSMHGQWENTTRMVAAKRLLVDMVDSLKEIPNLELGLRVYGHQFDRRMGNCYDTKLEVPFRADNHLMVRTRLLAIQPKGVTPIAHSLEQAANDFPEEDGVRNVIIIITDGIESCDGDPCAVSLALQRRRIFLKPFVIGLGMSREYEAQFDCLGEFLNVNRISEFRNALHRVVFQSLAETTVSVDLLSENGRSTEKDVNVTFLNNFTGESEYEFIHYRDQNGMPDSVEVDPVLTYDLVVNTIPQVIKRNVPIRPGIHNVLKVKAPQGTLHVRQQGHTEYSNGVKVLIRRAGDREVIHIQDVPEPEKLLVGNYDLEVLTIPRTYYNNVPIAQNQTRTINVPSPGIVNVQSGGFGIGSVYQLDENGRQRWVYNLETNKTRQTFALQPGRYKLVFRAEAAAGSKYTEIREFTIRPGSSTSLKLFGN